ncbi:hypothetical protein [Halomonas sp.]|uniref:sodium:solute symporter family transporter n=1 Tax=Halomonas sp. TaxID=1486246 RepID=UPI00257FF718|nr:hypothetical protein [Halomonas sp.]MCJ8286273.1 hypothetical protein [Halomonas sp.]NQY72684.1 hypothetical protein [Halomonas sp.]
MPTLDRVALLLALMVIVGTVIAYRRRAETPDGFVRGGGRVPWWMAGSTAFMTQFSAWTFTGAAQKAYEDGFSVLMIFWGNALGFLLAALYFAPRFRRLRVSTYSEIIRMRYGRFTQLFYVVSQILLTLMTASIALYGVSLFLGAVFDVRVAFVTLVIGAVIICVTLIGGVWVVSANNFIQMVQLAVLTFVIGGFGLWLAADTDMSVIGDGRDFWIGGDDYSLGIMVVWSAAMLVKQCISINNATSSYRFLTTNGDRDARKAASLASILFVVGPVSWFIPPWLIGQAGIDLAALYPALGEDAANAAYVHFIRDFLPPGVLGLVVAAMLAVTVAPITTSLNRDAGVIISLLTPLLGASERLGQRLVAIGRSFGVLQGSIIVTLAIALGQVHHLSLFDIMVMFGVIFQMPLALPAMLSIARTGAPDWAGWGGVLVGILVTTTSYLWLDVEAFSQWLGLPSIHPSQLVDIKLAVSLTLQVVSVVGFVYLARFVHAPPRSAARQAEVDELFARLERPVAADTTPDSGGPSRKLAPRLVQYVALVSLLLAVLADTWLGAGFFMIVALCQLVVSRLLKQ